MNDLIIDIDELLANPKSLSGNVDSQFFLELRDFKLEIMTDLRCGGSIDLIECQKLLNALCSLYGVYRSLA